MNFDFPNYATQCLNTLEEHGFEAWFVGGCVRDSLLGREFFDVDIATNALPEETEALFEKTLPTGKKHGTVTVLIGQESIEVTTFRSDGGYSDHRHPENVSFVSTVSDDLSRRDFTVNAFAYHPTRGLLDLYGGVNDLKDGIIRTVGCPKKRFSEDALRILRAFRFSSVLGFDIEDNTEKASYSCSQQLSSLSGERVLSEIKKLAKGKNPAIFSRLADKNCLSLFGIGRTTADISKITRLKEEHRAAALISLCSHDDALLKSRLKADNTLLKQISAMDTVRKSSVPADKTSLKMLLNVLGEENAALFTDYIKALYPDNELSRVTGYYNEITEKNEPFCIRHLKIDGNDLSALGHSGRTTGTILHRLTDEVIKKPELNSKDVLIKLVNKIM